MQIKQLLLIVPVALLLHACSSDSNYDFEQSIADQAEEFAASVAPSLQFDPANGVIPFPNNLLFSGSTDGTINAPADASNPADPALALNQMDGFSTTSPIVAGISRAVDPATVSLGSTVRVFEVTADPLTTAVTGVVSELGATQVLVVPTDTQIAILPLQPLKEKTNYMVVITNGIADASETPMPLAASTSFNLAKSPTELTGALAALEPVRQLTGAMLLAAGSQSIAPETVVMAWSFKTQSIRDVLQAVKDQVTPGALALASFGGATTMDINAGLQGKADIFIGTLDVPYYQSADPAMALSSIWMDVNGNPVSQFSPTPVATGTQTIPVIMTVPNATSMAGATPPANGWPVTIYQHGVTRQRSDIVTVADALADAGRAVIAIDLPLHGLSPITADGDPNPFHADNTPFPNDAERTFGIDLVDNNTRAPVDGGDGLADPSGQHYFNFQNLGNARDSLRQSVADLMVLSASLAGAQGEGVSLDASNVTFVGHSLGAMVGITYLSFDDTIPSATLAMPGGGIAQLLANSVSFMDTVNAGLTAVGAPPGSAAYSQFLVAAQTVLDSPDPINHATALAATGKNIHMIEAIGDETIPNAVATAPLAGTAPIVRQMGLAQVNGTTSGSALVRFTEGSHGSFISPASSLAATVEMQTQMAAYAASFGSVLQINDTTVIEAPPAQ